MLDFIFRCCKRWLPPCTKLIWNSHECRISILLMISNSLRFPSHGPLPWSCDLCKWTTGRNPHRIQFSLDIRKEMNPCRILFSVWYRKAPLQIAVLTCWQEGIPTDPCSPGMAGRNPHRIQFLVGDKKEFLYTPVLGGWQERLYINNFKGAGSLIAMLYINITPKCGTLVRHTHRMLHPCLVCQGSCQLYY